MKLASRHHFAKEHNELVFHRVNRWHENPIDLVHLYCYDAVKLLSFQLKSTEVISKPLQQLSGNVSVRG